MNKINLRQPFLIVIDPDPLVAAMPARSIGTCMRTAENQCISPGSPAAPEPGRAPIQIDRRRFILSRRTSAEAAEAAEAAAEEAAEEAAAAEAAAEDETADAAGAVAAGLPAAAASLRPRAAGPVARPSACGARPLGRLVSGHACCENWPCAPRSCASRQTEGVSAPRASQLPWATNHR